MEAALVGPAKAEEGAIEFPREPAFALLAAQQLRAHHRRERQRNEARDNDGARQSEGEFAKENAGHAGDKADRRINRGERDGHGDDRQRDLVGAPDRRVERRHALLDVAVNVLHHHNGVVDHEADAEHQRKQREQIDRIAERHQRDHHADERKRNGDDRNEGRTQIAEKEENHHDHDRRRFGERLGDLVDRGADEGGRIVGDRGSQAGRQLALDARHDRAHAVDHGQRIGLRRAIDADEHGLEAVEDRRGIDALRSELDFRDVAEPHQRVAVGRDHQLPERLGAVERGQRVDADLGVVAFDLAGRGGEVVGGERRSHVVRGHPERRHAGRVEPDAHGEGLAAENLGVGDAVDGLQARLDDAGQIVGDLGRGHHLRVERQVHEREALAGLLDHDRIVGVARQEAAHLIDLGQGVGHRPVGIGVETQIERDRRGVLLRGRDQRVDALGARHRLLDRGRDEALDDVGRGAGVGRGDGDRGVRGLGELPHLKPEGGHSADQQNEQADHGRQHRPADEEIGEGVHRRSVTAGAFRLEPEARPFRRS